LDDPRDARAWFSLGIRQQENERDDQSIQALLQSIRLEPSLREAYLALSVSYANEGDLREAHNVLEKWISIFHNDQGGGLGPSYTTMAKSERHQALADRLMEMARRAPDGDIDADIQVALGVLFNASEVSKSFS
jgi:peroxin-5